MLVGFTLLSSTFLLTPSAHDVISSLTTQQNSSAILLLRNIRLPRDHSLEINAETSVGACGSDLWQKLRDRWRAKGAERETKTHQTVAWRDEGRRDDGVHELGAEGNRQGRQQELGREAAQRRPRDALRTLSASAGSLHVLDDQARGARVQETEGAICAPARNWRRPRAKGHGLGPPGTAAFTGLLQALSERGSTVGAANAAGVAHLKQTWEDLEPERAFPHCKLAKVYDPALSRLEFVISVAQHR